MKREEIEELKGLAASMGLYDDKNPCKRAVILGKAIKVLEHEPREDATLKDIFCMGCEYKEQEPCEDAIDRKYLTGLMFTEADLSDAHTCYESIRKIVEEMPSVTPIRPRGCWIDKSPISFVCDKCNYEVQRYNNTNFCPSCGADMREPQESEEI